MGIASSSPHCHPLVLFESLGYNLVPGHTNNHTDTDLYTHTSNRIDTNTHTHPHTHARTHTHRNMHTHTRTHASDRTHTHSHTHNTQSEWKRGVPVAHCDFRNTE